MVDCQYIGCCLHLFLRCLFITSSIFSSRFIATASDRITRGQSLRDGDTIVSSEERFELGFFSPQDSNLHYVGIWHYQLTTERSVVWVANRDNPISGNDGVLTVGEDGNLILFNDRQGNISLWSSNVTVPSSSSSNSTLVLTDAGNLVLYGNNNGNPSIILWQSFDHPTDTYLPEMRVYLNVEGGGGEERIFTSWRNASDPSSGNFSMGVDSRGPPQIIIWAGPNRHWRSGHWNGLMFTGVPNVRVGYIFGFRLLNEDDGGLYFTYTTNSSNTVKFMIGPQGAERQELWNETSREWNLIQSFPTSECERYNFCGAFATCDDRADARKCSCIEGFVSDDNNGGCVRRTQLGCDVEEENRNNGGVRTDAGFVRVEGVKLPDFVDYVGSRDENECRNMCLDNCSCNAYAFVSGINCMMWNRELVDIQQFEEGGNDLFVRVSSSDLPGETNRTNIVIIIIVITVLVATLSGVSVSIWLIRRHKANKYHDFPDTASDNAKPCPGEEPCADFSQPSDLGVLSRHCHETSNEQVTMFSLAHVVTATDNFSEANRLGRGGFGPVYKGTLPGGEKIAVKRLSRSSGQGLEEFKNETTLIAKLQHRNLVRLLGCCIQGEEKMLLYEYMPNKSLDFYLFDRERRAQLDWIKRFNIIKGIARGLLYLHRDSRLRIIHRDLKPSNILLDEEMNPKISDFGMARMFSRNQNEANTNRVMGTYGYMAPEYAMEGLFSVKSDVYSFGVLLLEIISGQRNTTFRQTDDSSIISYAWDLWSSSRAIEFLDPLISSSCKDIEVDQVLTCMHVGMLCVQDIVSDRPNMSAIMVMLEIDGDQITSTLPMPTKPTFMSIRHNVIEKRDFVSSNDVTISVILGR